ncbi:hypothetical protein diail_4891 [Diaporthe ilicicola]|nr:hypothetical protein diail_4891 [Diaporthe ilicicola]
METHTNFASYDMAPDNYEPSEIDDLLRQMEWEQSIDQQMFAASAYDATNFEESLSPLSGFASPSSMTTGSTNQSPIVPLLDYDMSFSVAPSTKEPENLFPELVDHSTINMYTDWPGTAAETYTGPVLTSNDTQAKIPSVYPMQSQLYTAAAPDMTTHNPTLAPRPYFISEPPTATAQTSPAAPSSSTSPQQTTTTDLTCPQCGATFTDKTKLKVHTNKHTKPFRCTAAGCGYEAAEKKSLQRHLQAKSKWDDDHRAAARSEGVPQRRFHCGRPGCTYATVREDNLKRHMKTCSSQ